MGHLRRFSESSVRDKYESYPANCYRLWVTKHPSGARPARMTRRSFDFPLRAGTGGLKSVPMGSFLSPTVEEEEMSGSGDEPGLADDKNGDKLHAPECRTRFHRHQGPLRREQVLAPSCEPGNPHPRGTAGLKILIKRLSLSLLKTRSFVRTRSQPELSMVHSFDHPAGPSRVDRQALVFGDENPEKIDERSGEFYKTFFPSLVLG
ncbi:hypothetical protein PTTG_08636 [Puccinia triticina 1-1 BBBD Race 1]|uniref:Uncharacterized protein n=1 Tax=Puccinia triticina (isolate 1-1 / race 1 (BBBD)) TaxID=630390 RepID=A0A180GJ44_PUCT1|nr:hypothetical protein PTTG_08636 [Puccinia triticina 1-1 BBBD Race 1]WAR52090.1 hypothetical protein PtB15_1B529 [Puccinia triticina]